MAELADAQASGACGRKIVWVQVPSPALFFCFAEEDIASQRVFRSKDTGVLLNLNFTSSCISQ